MDKKAILYLHGFASSAQSKKARYFRDRFERSPHVEYHALDLNPTPTDFEYVTTTGLIDRTRQYVLDHRLGAVDIIASSFGGLIALQYAHRHGGVGRMLLLAPGLAWLSGGLSEAELDVWEKDGALPVYHEAFGREVRVRFDLQLDGVRYLQPAVPSNPIVIIHGRNDETVPPEHSRAFAADFPHMVRLVEVDAGHDLNGHLELIWGFVQSFLLGA